MDRYFGIAAQGSTVRIELMAGLTTFLTMAYILFVNPLILGEAGLDKGAVFVATCLASAFGTALMGLYANYPIALAPGMGLNAYFTYGVVMGMHQPWPVALGAVFLSGILFLILSVTRLREWVVNGIPHSQKLAISAGIGLFLGIIALKNAGLIAPSKETYLTLGDVRSPPALLATLGFVVMVALDARKVPGAILLSVLGVTVLGITLGVSPFGGVVALPPSLAPLFFKLDLAGALNLGAVTVIFAFFFVDLFDSTGTLIGVAHRAGFIQPDGTIPRLRRVLISDSIAILVGAVLGTSTVTSYIESAAGVKAGGRTGLVGLTVAALFLVSLVLAPLAGSVPAYATAPALLYVACIMARGLTEIDWEDPTDYAPAVVTALAMPLTFSIANGIAFGFITYVATKLLAGKFRQAGLTMIVLALLFALRYALLAGS
jgi:AGZA family xanthine/uracil permease-like MFS transporter